MMSPASRNFPTKGKGERRVCVLWPRGTGEKDESFRAEVGMPEPNAHLVHITELIMMG